MSVTIHLASKRTLLNETNAFHFLIINILYSIFWFTAKLSQKYWQPSHTAPPYNSLPNDQHPPPERWVCYALWLIKHQQVLIPKVHIRLILHIPYGFGQMCNDIYLLVWFNCSKKYSVLHLFILFSSLGKKLLAVTEFFTLSLVLHFLECHMVGIS
jgi:hypothetical protein